jgi:hypothetical protein
MDGEKNIPCFADVAPALTGGDPGTGAAVEAKRITNEMVRDEDIIQALTGGDAASAAAINEVIQFGNAFDVCYPSFSYMESIDKLALYDGKMGVLYHLVCGDDIGCTTAVLRAFDLGLVTREAIHEATDAKLTGKDCAFDLDELLKKVQVEHGGYVRLKTDIAPDAPAAAGAWPNKGGRLNFG